MKYWQMWMIIFYVCVAQVASETFLIGIAAGSLFATVFFAWRGE